MRKEVSNRTIFVLMSLVVLVSVISSFVIVDSVNQEPQNNAQVQEHAGSNTAAGLVILEVVESEKDGEEEATKI